MEINQETLDVLITKLDFAVQVSHRAFRDIIFILFVELVGILCWVLPISLHASIF